MSVEDKNRIADKERMFELIKSSLELFSPNQQLMDNFITGEYNLTIFERKALLLGKLLDKDKNYNLKSKLNDLLFSHGLKDNRYYTPFLEILREIHKEKITDDNILDVFLEKLDAYIETLKNKPLAEYTLIFPINLKFKNETPSVFLQRDKDISIQLVPKIKNYLNTIWE